MNFQPLFDSPWHIQVHAIAAIAALLLGVVQFVAPKGTLPHRILGPIWAILMAAVIISAIFIIRPRDEGESLLAHFTFIHYIFIPVTTWGLIGGLYFVLRGGPDMKRHAGPFFGIFLGGLIIAGAFTFMPGRIMHDVVFNKSMSDNPYAYDAPYLYFLPGAEPPERDLTRKPSSEEIVPEPTLHPDSAHRVRYHDAVRAYDTVATLASAEYEGRRTNTEGAEKARTLIAERFAEIGLVPLGNDGYFDDFEWSPDDLATENRRIFLARNVIGMIKGKVESGDGPVIVVTAHYDHMGVNEEGVMYPGADDNASGVAAMLEAAAWFAENPPTHTILFVGFDAEEFGLRGARDFVANPPVDADRIAFNLNFDMAARADNGILWAIGTYHFPYLKPYVWEVINRAPIDLRMGFDEPTEDRRNDWTYLSDQGAFIRQGIPAIYLGVEDHPDYHQPTDTADRIDRETYSRIVDTAILLAVEIDENLGEIVSARAAAEAADPSE